MMIMGGGLKVIFQGAPLYTLCPLWIFRVICVRKSTRIFEVTYNVERFFSLLSIFMTPYAKEFDRIRWFDSTGLGRWPSSDLVFLYLS